MMHMKCQGGRFAIESHQKKEADELRSMSLWIPVPSPGKMANCSAATSTREEDAPTLPSSVSGFRARSRSVQVPADFS